MLRNSIPKRDKGRGADNEGRDMGCVRENFQNGLDAVIGWYRGALQSNAALQEAFIRKFDDLCE
jgi:hypothetical protein